MSFLLKSWSSKECKSIKRKPWKRGAKNNVKKNKKSKEWENFERTILNFIWNNWNKSSKRFHKEPNSTSEWKPKWPIERVSTTKRKCKSSPDWLKSNSTKNNSRSKSKSRRWSKKKKKKGLAISMWWRLSSGRLILNIVIKRMSIIWIPLINFSCLLSWLSVKRFTLIHKSSGWIKWELFKPLLMCFRFTIQAIKHNFSKTF